MKIGIEVHIQLNTKSKIFCSCANETDTREPNTTTCEICLGMPGSKPAFNKGALIKATRVALALDCKIQKKFFFSRKSYFYPDLPKNFQISQYEIPLAVDGSSGGIRIRRVHLEEDPGKLMHSSSYVLIDYNRSGVPLIEVVTEPDFKSPKDVRVFLEKLTTTLEYLDVYYRASEAAMRVDANISLGDVRVEVKNIFGIKDVERALNYEIIRQEGLIKRGEQVARETRAWNAETGTTKFLRGKEQEEDYGYIFEPDLVKIELEDSEIKNIKKELPELPDEKKKRFCREYKITDDDAEVLVSNNILAEMYETVVKKINPKLAAQWLRRELLRVLNYNRMDIYELKGFNVDYFTELLGLLQNKSITPRMAQQMLNKLIVKPFSPKEFINKGRVSVIKNEKELRTLCEQVMKENKKAVEDYRGGEQKALHFLIGQVIRKTRGAAKADMVNEIFKKLVK